MLINFDAGPASLPKSVLKEAAVAINNFDNTGLSILELPHRGKHFGAILEEVNHLASELLQIPANYNIIWMQGGGRHQFGMIPMNFLMSNETAGYIHTGHWSKNAINYALYYGKVRIVASSEDDNFDHIPAIPAIDNSLAYLHLTSNNTIYGTQFAAYPKVQVPLIADMSSDIFSKKIPIEQFAMIYAVAQKNIGPAGVTMAIIRNDLAQIQKRPLPPYYTYRGMVAENSMINTPPVFAIYCCLLNLRYLNNLGMSMIEQNNFEKANAMYAFLKQSKLFNCVAKADRSNMNVCIKMKNASLTDAFINYAEAQNITGIRGHRSVGGIRVSLYNAISLSDVKTLIDVMKHFESKA